MGFSAKSVFVASLIFIPRGNAWMDPGKRRWSKIVRPAIQGVSSLYDVNSSYYHPCKTISFLRVVGQKQFKTFRRCCTCQGGEVHEHRLLPAVRPQGVRASDYPRHSLSQMPHISSIITRGCVADLFHFWLDPDLSCTKCKIR